MGLGFRVWARYLRMGFAMRVDQQRQGCVRVRGATLFATPDIRSAALPQSHHTRHPFRRSASLEAERRPRRQSGGDPSPRQEGGAAPRLPYTDTQPFSRAPPRPSAATRSLQAVAPARGDMPTIAVTSSRRRIVLCSSRTAAVFLWLFPHRENFLAPKK